MRTIVVGAASGIGLALCKRWASRGDRLLATCRKASPELEALAAGARHVEVLRDVDVTSDEAVARLLAHDREPIDLLLVAAGRLERIGLDALDWDAIRAQLEINALGPLRVAAALHPRLHAGSKLVFLTSRMGSIADNTSGGHYGYRMSKAALNMAARSLAHDLRGREITVAVLHPGFVRTPMTHGQGNLSPEESAALLDERITGLTLADSGSFLHASGESLPW